MLVENVKFVGNDVEIAQLLAVPPTLIGEIIGATTLIGKLYVFGENEIEGATGAGFTILNVTRNEVEPPLLKAKIVNTVGDNRLNPVPEMTPVTGFREIEAGNAGDTV